MADTLGTVILLVGPTGVGKTGTAVLLAKELGSEIISADSMQIYRHMDIGTEKPTPEQRRLVRHHMVDVVEPSEEYSVARYVAAVEPLVRDLHARGSVPLVVGGTGLYVKAMTRGIFPGPGANPVLRAELESHPLDDLHNRLRELDPETAAALPPTDRRRIVRALEVCLMSGRPMSDLKRDLTVPFPCRFVKIALTRDRKELYRMIEERVDVMMRRGLLEEVRRLLDMRPSRTPLQAIGYKELIANLHGEYGLHEAVRLIKRNTKRYAKRQFTWFGREEGLRWIDITGLTDARDVLPRLWPLLNSGGIL